MADTIDELKIEVEADAGNASGAIDGLINDISRLSESVGKLNTNKLGKLQTSLEAIGKIKFDSNFSGLQGISNLLNSMANMPNASDFTKLANGISKLNQADSSNIKKLSGDLDTLSKAMNSLRSGNSYNINIDMGKLAPTSDEVTNTEQLGESLNSVNESLSSSQNSVHVYIDEMGNLSDSVKDAAESEGELKDAADSVQESVNSTNDSASSSSEAVYTLGDALKTTQSALKSFGSALLSVGSGIVKADFSMISGTLEAAGTAASSLAEKVGEVAEGIADIVLQSSPLGTIPELFRSISNASDFLERKLRKVVNLFVMMGTRKAFTAVFKEMGSAFEDLSADSESVSANMESLSSAMSTLAHNITAAAEPLLNIFAPALETIINLLNTAIVYVNQFLAALSGKRYVSVATASISTYSEGIETLAEDAEDATEANKKLNKQLQGFNELNNLTTTETSSGSGGSGGSGGAGEGVGGYYEDIDIASDIQDFVDKLLEAWENSDFTEIGAILGEKLKEALESIPWDEIQYYAEKVAHSLATLINGFIEVEGLGETIGNTLGEAINTALIFADEFLTTLHWDSLGQFVADIVNGAIESVDWDLLGKTLGDAVAAWLEYGFNFITTVDWESLGADLAESINGFVDIANEALLGYDWTEIGRSFANGLNAGLADIDWEEVGELVANGFNTILADITGFVEEFDFSGFGQDVADAMNAALAQVSWASLGTTIQTGINGVFSSVNNWAANFDFGSFGDDIATAINNALNGINWSDAITAAKNIGSGIAEALNNVLTADTFSNLGSTIAGALNTAIAGVGAFLDDTNFKEVGQAVAAGFNKWMADMDFEELGRTLGGVVQAALDFLSGFINDGGVDWGAVKDALQELWNGICEKVDFDEAGPLIVAALGIWLGGNLVSGVLSAMGTAVTLNFAVGLAEALAGGVAATGLGTVVTALGGALAAALGVAGIAYIISQVDWESVGQAISDQISDTIGDIKTTITLIFEADGDFSEEIYESLDEAIKPYYVKVHAEAVVEELIENLDDDQKSVKIMGELIEIFKAAGLDTSNVTIDDLVGYVNDLVAANPDMTIEDITAAICEFINEANEAVEVEGEITDVQPAHGTHLTISDLEGLVGELIFNIDDKDLVVDLLGQIYEVIFGVEPSSITLEGLTGVIDYLETNGQLTVSNVIASVTMYGYLTEIYDETTSEQRKTELIGQIKQLLIDSGVKEVDDLEGRITDIINDCDSPLDAIARIYQYLVDNDLMPEIDTKGNVTSADTSEIDGTEVDVVADANKLDTKDVEGEDVDVIGDVTDLNESHLSDRELAVLGKVTDLINGNYDNKLDCIAEIIKMVTGSDATSQQIEGVTAIIDDLKSRNELTAENVIAEIMKLLVPNGTSINADVEADNVFVPDGYYVDLDGNLHKLSYDQTDPIDVNGKMTVDEVKTPKDVTLEGVIADVAQAVHNGTLSLDQVSALISAIETATGVKLTSPMYASSLDANGKSLSAAMVAASLSDNSKTLSVGMKASSVANNSKTLSVPMSASSLSRNGKSVSAPINASSLSRNGKSLKAPVSASSISRNGKSVKAPVKSSSISRNGNSVSAPVRATSITNISSISIPGKVTSLTKGSNLSLSLSGSVRTMGLTALMTLSRNGGVFQAGRHFNIPQYDSGSLNAGSMFIAGEAGPELVGHIGGRTEVLNASQLATVMRDSIVAGLSSLAVYLTRLERQTITNANGIINAIVVCYNTPSIMPSTSNVGMSMESKVNDMDADREEMIDLLSQIAQNTSETERYQFETDPYNIFKAVRKENNEYRQATGKSAFV